MKDRLTFVVASERPELVETLAHSGRASVVGAVEDAAELAGAVARHRPDALLVDLGPHPGDVLDRLEALPAPRPLLVVRGPDDSATIVRAMRLGAREYLTPGEDPKQELLAALERVLHERGRTVPGEARRAPLLAVMGAKGGVGATFVACQLAAALAEEGARVALVDGKLRIGDVALYLDLRPRYTMASLASATDTVDAAYLQTVLVPHATGVQVLAAPERPEEADLIGVRELESALRLLREGNDWVVVDTPHEFDERSVHLLDRAEAILLVSTCDVPALHHTRLQLELLQRLGHSPHKIHVIVNRVDKKAPLRGRQVAEFLERKVALSLPNDYAHASACVNEGKPLSRIAPRAPLRRALSKLRAAAYRWCEVPERDEDGTGRGLLGWFGRKHHGSA